MPEGSDDTSTDEPTATDDTAADTPSVSDDTSTDDTTTPTDDDADAAKWKAMARKHEKEAKAAKAEAEKLRRAQLSESEKAVEEARDAGRAEARAEAAALIAAAELKAAGVPAEDVADLNLANFIGEDGTIDTDRVKATGERFAGRQKASAGSADGGPRGDTPKPPSIEDQIAEAQSKGDAARVITLNNQMLAAMAAGSSPT